MQLLIVHIYSPYIDSNTFSEQMHRKKLSIVNYPFFD